MCGIYASVGFAPDLRNLDIVSHRGPDGRGWKLFESAAGPVALGHRRLSIVDLDERSAQPMSCRDGRFWLTFNGEIYNFVELRAELEDLDYCFRTTSDSEVLLEAYVVWGEAMLERLRGMFAFVIYDVREQRLFAARDRFGIKPLYYFVADRGFAFASEIKQLVDLPGFSRRINLARTYDYLSAGFTDHTEETMFADARQLRGGQCVSIDLKTWRPASSLPVRRYYDLPRQPLPRMSEAEAAARFLELFEDSVRIHLRSDVRVGSCLSGGLDSSSIVVMMDKMLGRSLAELIHTVSACYEDKAVDEKPFVDLVVASTRTEPHYIYPSAERAFGIAERITWHQDEPHYNTSMYAQWCVFEEAQNQSIKVMLDGQGADELLAGYHHDAFSVHAGALMRKGDILGLGRMLLERKRWHGVGWLTQFLTMPGRPRAPEWLRGWRPAAAPAPGEGWLDTPALEAGRSPGGAYQNALLRDGVGEVGDIGDLCVASLLGVSLPKLLRYEDRNSMAHSIEARLPFLDHRLVEFTIGLWDQHKIVGGDTKRVLRSAMAGYLPEPVRKRRDKIGFATPQQDWFRGPLRPAIEAGVRDTLDHFPGLLNKTAVLEYLNSAMSGRRSADQRLWILVNLGIWGKVFNMRV